MGTGSESFTCQIETDEYFIQKIIIIYFTMRLCMYIKFQIDLQYKVDKLNAYLFYTV